MDFFVVIPAERSESRDLETTAAAFDKGGFRVEVPDLAFGSSGTTAALKQLSVTAKNAKLPVAKHAKCLGVLGGLQPDSIWDSFHVFPCDSVAIFKHSGEGPRWGRDAVPP